MGDNQENTPGRQAIVAMADVHKEIIFKKPTGVAKKRAKEKILDEDSYVEEIGKIIQRDFFPDLEKLKAQNEYLDAVERNDILKIREMHQKYSGSRPPTQRRINTEAPGFTKTNFDQFILVPSPATFETPANIHNSQESTEAPPVVEPDKNKESRLSLDQFLNSHTSQDNQSFNEILVESDRKHRLKYSYLFKEEDKSQEIVDRQLVVPSIEQQAQLAIKPLNLDSWGYKNRNFIMYVPDGVPLTPEQELEINKKRQEVVHSNTRLEINPFNESQSKETINELAKTQAKVLDGKIGVDGKELISNTPKVRGFAFVRSPSPVPGAQATPLMTWGEIEGTPFRLDGGDTPLPRGRGPSFKMAEPPRREQIALALAEKVGEKNREKKQKAMEAAKRHLAAATPSPARSLTGAERLATMSPAARRLATTKLRLGDLKTPSPMRAVKTPGTPKRMVTPKLNLGIRKLDDNLTDDLLKINLPKRQKAADFF